MAKRLCPVWVGYLLASPLRKLIQNPKKILGPHVKEGMMVLDIGCAMGFFSLPLAQMVGTDGEVLCVDVQEKMIKSLEKRAQKTGLSNRIETHKCHTNSLGLENHKEKIDFALAFAVIHEVADASRLLSEIYTMIKPTGRFLIAEPKGHISKEDFEMTVSIAEQNGFHVIDKPRIGRSHVVLLEKKE